MINKGDTCSSEDITSSYVDTGEDSGDDQGIHPPTACQPPADRQPSANHPPAIRLRLPTANRLPPHRQANSPTEPRHVSGAGGGMVSGHALPSR